MKYKLYIETGNNVGKDRVLISYYFDYADRNKSRFLKKDGNYCDAMDRLENETDYIAMKKGADPRKAWQEAWHAIRSFVRRAKESTSGRPRSVVGYEFFPGIFIAMDYDPKRLP